MGMFDYVSFNGEQYQTKDTPKQSLDNYKIELDLESNEFKLYHEDYVAKWVESPEDMFGGHIEQDNYKWVFCYNFIGEIRFYRCLNYAENHFEEYSAYFYNGVLKEIHLIRS